MTRLRLISAALVVAGVTLGSWADAGDLAPPPRAGGYYVLAGDFHVHAFPGDGALLPSQLAREASRRGLHVIVVSNHNQTLATRFIDVVRSGGEDGEPIVIPAQEITSPLFHLVAAGIRRTVDWRLSEEEMARAVRAQGGVIIGAHPVEKSWRGSDAMLAALDGIEVAHPMTDARDATRAELDARYARARAVNPGVAPIGSSDFHMVAPLGARRTFVFAESVSVDGVLDAIRAGRTLAENGDGTLYGRDDLKALLVNARPSRGETPSPFARFAVVMSLVGLLGLAVLR